MPDELYVPTSEPLKQSRQWPHRSLISTIYLLVTCAFHLLVIVRSIYILVVHIYGKGLTFTQWHRSERIYFMMSLGILLATIGSLYFLKSSKVVFIANVLFFIIAQNDDATIANFFSSQNNATYIFYGLDGILFWSPMFFMIFTVVIYPLIKCGSYIIKSLSTKRGSPHDTPVNLQDADFYKDHYGS